jgi:hypothetical protein
MRYYLGIGNGDIRLYSRTSRVPFNGLYREPHRHLIGVL